MQMLQDHAKTMKKQMNQICQTIDSTRQTRTRQKAFHQTEFVQNEPASFKVAAKLQHCRQSNRDNFRVGNFYATIFFVVRSP
jgi:hypothetical protein